MTGINRTTSENKDFQNLVIQLDTHLKHIDGDDHAFYAQFNKLDSIRNVIVYYMDNIPVGCGAFKEYDTQKAEIKRMFVLPQYRGNGIGLKVLNELEKWIAELKYPVCILETSKKLPAAIKLYQKAGYSITSNFPPYENDEDSVCMIKHNNKM